MTEETPAPRATDSQGPGLPGADAVPLFPPHEERGRAYHPGTVAGSPYSRAYAAYRADGWLGTLPLPPGEKSPPPSGWTGHAALDPDDQQAAAWLPGGNIALRLPDTVIGIDVDHYGDKHGADTLAALEREHGGLPATWASTARGGPDGPGPSRVLLYRLPAPEHLAGTAGPGIDVIQAGHRYLVVAPSVHPGTGTEYIWYNPHSEPMLHPCPGDLPELPPAWLAFLRTGAATPSHAGGPAAGYALRTALERDTRPLCSDLADRLEGALARVRDASAGSRHDVMAAAVHSVVHLAASGHGGAATALEQLREAFTERTDPGRGGAEFDRAVTGSCAKAAGEMARPYTGADPCAVMAGLIEQLPGDRAAAVEQAAAAAGVVPAALVPDLGEFDPGQTQTDHGLAAAIVRYVHPIYRYAGGDVHAWIARGPLCWRVIPPLKGKSLVTYVAERIVRGDSQADPDTPAGKAWKRYLRLCSSAGSSAIGAQIDALVVRDDVSRGLAVGALDADDDVLWAGGVPWDLRASGELPVPSGLDYATPHMMTAACAPDPTVPTPRWDAFLAAVWPDPEVRSWALDVLSLCLAGGTFKMMPVLYGPTNAGKSTVLELLDVLLTSPGSVGGRYAWEFPTGVLTGRPQHNQAKFDLRGRRLAMMDEGLRDGDLYLTEVKRWTGTAPIVADPKGKEAAIFYPTYTLVVAQNDPPSVKDPAVRSRVRAIPCDGDPAAVRAAVIPLRDRGDAGFREEAPGVLAGLMRRVARVLADQSLASTDAAPAVLREAEAELADEQDTVGEWLAVRTVAAPGARTRSRDLYDDYARWWTARQRDGAYPRYASPESETAWGRVVSAAGFDRTVWWDPALKRAVRIRPLILRSDFGGGSSPLTPPPGEVRVPVTEPVSVKTRSSEGVATTALTGLPVFPIREDVNKEEKIYRAYRETPESGNTGDEAEVPTPKIAGQTPSFRLTPTGEAHVVSGEETDKPTYIGHTETSVPLLSCKNSGTPPDSGAARPPAGTKALTATERKRREKEAARDAAAGPAIGLPAVVVRGLPPQRVDVATARATIAHQVALGGVLAVDVETSGYPLGHPDYALRAVQLGGATAAVVLDPRAHADVITDALTAAPRLAAHSATADLAPLADAGLCDYAEAWSRMTDTALRAKLADPRSTGNGAGGLKALAAALLPDAASPAADEARVALFTAHRWKTETDATTPPERSGWGQCDYTRATMITYAASDVLDCAALDAVLPWPDPAVWKREHTLAAVTGRSAYTGLELDGPRVTERTAHHRAAKAASTADITGRWELENPGSPAQVLRVLRSEGASVPDTKSATLEPLSASEGPGSEFAAAVLDYRHHATALSLLLEPWTRLTEHGDGVARPTVYTLGTLTGRMSCVRPNLQQVSREGGLRECLRAREGHRLIAADFSSVEVRVLAALSGDPALTRMVLDGIDLHTVITEAIYGPKATDPRHKAHRYRVKRLVFGKLYGGGVKTLAAQAGVTMTEAARVIAMLEQITPVAGRSWPDTVRREVAAGRTQFVSYSGRVIHLDPEFPHKLVNTLVQGTARELLADALIQWDGGPWGGGVVLPVHDEIVAEVPAGQEDAATAFLVRCMTREINGVSIVAEADEPMVQWRSAT